MEKTHTAGSTPLPPAELAVISGSLICGQVRALTGQTRTLRGAQGINASGGGGSSSPPRMSMN
jgi:hypothetical protein